MFDQPQDFTVEHHSKCQPSEVFNRHFTEYNRKYNEFVSKNNRSFDHGNSLKTNRSSGPNSTNSEQTMSPTFVNRKVGSNIDDIVHIVILNNHLYVQRNLLTCLRGSKLASVFTQDSTEFELVRNPRAFKLLLEFLRLSGQINSLRLSANDLELLLGELNYWGIS